MSDKKRADLQDKSKDELISMINSMEGTAKLKGGEKGWMVTTSNQNYNGKTAGVQFNGGRAFLSPHQYSKEQIDVLIRTLKNDFGYNVVEATVDEFYGRQSGSVDDQVRASLEQKPAAEPTPAK